MKKVQYHLLGFPKVVTTDELFEAQRLINEEQATLDVMEGQVKTTKAKKGPGGAPQNILEAMRIGIEEPSKEDIRIIKRQLGRNVHQYQRAFKVMNHRTQGKFDNFIKRAKNKTVRQFWHGSRNENWWSIIDSGLILRPTNAIKTGAMFGEGLYFADKSQKSIGYTSLRGSYWTGGTATKGFLSLYDVHLGSYLQIMRHQSWCYSLNKQNLRNRGQYDSLFAEGGADLRNNEFIVYDDAQCTIKYLVEIK